MTTLSRARANRATLLACLLSGTSTLAIAQDATGLPRSNAPVDALPGITVYAPRPGTPAEEIVDLAATPPATPYSDGGDFLRSKPGVSAARIGGHGMDIVIRGQTMNQLNVTSNGATTYGACPSRMDPPTAYYMVESYDEIEIVRGYQTVLNGPGGTGGSVDFRYTRPRLGPDVSIEGDISTGYETNGDVTSASAYALTGNEDIYLRATASMKDAKSYEDGSGTKVRSAFEDTQAGITLGFTPSDATHAYLTYNQTRILDAEFAGTGMDSPDSKSKAFNAGIEHEFGNGPVKAIEVTAYNSAIDHVMDNYSLRTPAAMYMRVNVTSDTYGGAVKTDFDLGGQELRTAIDYRHYERKSASTMGMSFPMLRWTQTQPYETDEFGIAAETTFTLAEATRLVTGLRYDHVSVDFGPVSRAAGVMTPSPDTLYQTYYGYTASGVTENNVGGLARIEHELGESTTLFGSLSRSVRTADATERSIANGMGTSLWIGNPRIKPEKHHQAELGVSETHRDWNLDGSVYVNRVTDYILRDSARGQDGILVANTNADIYRNIDALLAGIELRGGWDISDTLTFEGDATYTYGEDLDLNQALPQVPPLQGTLRLNWLAMDGVELGGAMRYAIRQTRVDPDATTGTGRDVRETPGYAVFDLTANVALLDPVTLTFGATNLFDVDYANHLNKSNAYDPVEVQVNEPGRSVFVKARLAF